MVPFSPVYLPQRVKKESQQKQNYPFFCSKQSMARDHPSTSTSTSVRLHLCFLIFLSVISSTSIIFWLSRRGEIPKPFCLQSQMLSDTATDLHFHMNQTINLLSFPSAWNHLHFSSNPPPKLLKIAVFVKKWPRRNLAGGLERHASTLHLALAMRGHELHVFTTNSSSSFPVYPNVKALHFHLTRPTAAGYINQPLAWDQFVLANSTGRPFDVVHTESVALYHRRAINISNLVVSWHGIAYETIHSNIVRDLHRSSDEPQPLALTEMLPRVVDEIKFFKNYAHHVATSDHVGDVLRRIYMIPEDRVHVILNGVDEAIYKLDVERGREYRRIIGIPEDASLVIGMAGRLVKDKGHPVMFEALKQLMQDEDDGTFRRNVYVLVAGDGPWGNRYKELGSHILVLGPLEQNQLARFYNSLDVFVNPTLRAQGLDHTFLEAMMCGVPVMGTRFASITGSIISGPEIGHTFSPTVESIKDALRLAWMEGKEVLKKKGEAARKKAVKAFSAGKMAAAYERLFLCISSKVNGSSSTGDLTGFCTYPLPSDPNRPTEHNHLK